MAKNEAKKFKVKADVYQAGRGFSAGEASIVPGPRPYLWIGGEHGCSASVDGPQMDKLVAAWLKMKGG